jgi:hypothetical protein
LQLAVENLQSAIPLLPVVQRIEQGFPKGRRPFLHEFADVLSAYQMTPFKHVK